MNDDPHHAHCYNRPSSWQGSLLVENPRYRTHKLREYFT